MTKKIFLNSFTVGLSVLLVCCAIFIWGLYDYYEELTYTELATEAGYIKSGVELAGEDYLGTLDGGSRVTLVAQDGSVLYDSAADPAKMENHLNREEIAAALKDGEGRSAHYSKTLLVRTLYYALRLDDGMVLRVACERRSAAALLIMLLSPMGWAALAVIGLCFLLALRLSRQITKPINSIDPDSPTLDGAYRELEPLIARLREQNRTIRKQMNELSLKSREFSAITDNMSEGFLLLDNKLNILSGNNSAAEILGGSIQGRVSPEISRAAAGAIAGARSTQLLETEGRVWQALANPVVANNQVTGVVVILMDVTEREQREALRREFSANVSHELKTPLTSISGFAELMRDGYVPMEKVREFSGDIYRESQRMISLIEDIINLSKLDENPAALEWEQVELSQLARDILESLRPIAARRNIELSLRGGPATIRGVRQILSELIYNLCDNAVKYNREGGSVAVSLETGTGGTRLTVADTGIGIPYAHQSRVFERFYRVDKSHSREIGGTGLGLSIVKHAAQFHGAELRLKSEAGVGTEITVLFK